MAIGPFQSKLSPFQDLIAALRARQPPVTYAGIAGILKAEHQLVVHRGTIQHFVKVRGSRALYHLDDAGDKAHQPIRAQKTTGKVPEEVFAHMNKLKQKAGSAEERHEPYLPTNGRLTYKEKP
jgi:hypothetical protein